MKTTRISRLIIFCALLPMLHVLAGCTDKELPRPVISVQAPSSPVGPEGGVLALAVSVTNPV